MDATAKSVESRPTKMTYQSPAMKKHDPVKIVQGSSDCDSWNLYYVTLYYYV